METPARGNGTARFVASYQNRNRIRCARAEVSARTHVPRSRVRRELDNSVSWVEGKPNPIKIWAEMKVPASENPTQDLIDLMKLFDLLTRTGALKWLNAIDPNDGLRPIDATASYWAIVHFGC